MWKECLLALQGVAEVVCIQRAGGDSDVLFTEIDAIAYVDEPRDGDIASMSVPRLFNIRDDIFEANLDSVANALGRVQGIQVHRDGDQVTVTQS